MGMIQEFQKADEERRREVKKLQHEVVNIRSGVATMLRDLAKGDTERASEVGNIRSGVATMLKDFGKGDTERDSEVARIRSEEGNIRSGVATMLKDLAKEDAERAKGDAERARGRAHLHTEVWGRASAKKVTTAPVVELAKESPPGEKVVEGASLSELRDKVFAYLANHPDGTMLIELEGEFGVARIQIAKVTRSLIEDNKVEKRDLLYFAI